MKGKTAAIKFNKKIYPAKEIQKAIADFKQLASFSLSENKSYRIVKISDVMAQEDKLIGNEFSNYALSLIKH
ncbi:MAG: HxsD-like protein [Patescibacteria group bacterium]|nr:HxsD-like protein [Patescibacteria group bacterium]